MRLKELMQSVYGEHRNKGSLDYNRGEEFSVRDLLPDDTSYNRAYVQYSRGKSDRGEYQYIPFYNQEFVSVMSTLSSYIKQTDNKDELTFIDIGSGIGDKPMLARMLCGFDKAIGVEYDAETCEFAQRVVPSSDVYYLQADAFSLTNIAADVVYMYSPMADRSKQLALLAHTLNVSSVGARVIEVAPWLYLRPIHTTNTSLLTQNELLKMWDDAFELQKWYGNGYAYLVFLITEDGPVVDVAAMDRVQRSYKDYY